MILAKKRQPGKREARIIADLLANEEGIRSQALNTFTDFKNKVFEHRESLRAAVKKINNKGKKIIGYGASTKGNVILQFCGFTPKDIPFIAEVNQDKFGRFTPGTLIPIISETGAMA